MAALETVQDYVDRARVLLLDQTAPYRYSDSILVEALNMAILEGRRIRPDLFRSFFRATDGMPEYLTSAMGASVSIDQMYRVPFVYYIVGHTQMIDEEDVSDQRAVAMMKMFTQQLLSING